MRSSLAVGISAVALATAQAPQPVPGVTGQLGDAKVESGNPTGVTYVANLLDKSTTGVRGSVSVSSGAGGVGVSVSVNIFGLPSESLGPFLYHIHDQPVPADGNCTKTLAHLDPYVRGEKPPCLASQPQTCQSGDLSGKHGNITSPGLQTTYSDAYLATKEGVGAFIGNRSIVVHTSNTTRLNCANFVLSTSGSNTTGGSPTGGAGSTGGGSTPSPPTAAPSPFTGAAAANFAGATGLCALAVAAVAFVL